MARRTLSRRREGASSGAGIIARAAERRIGELLAEMPKAKGGAEPGVGRRGKNAIASGEGIPSVPTLKDHGITESQSSRYQAVAQVPEEEFERLAEESVKKRKPLTANALVGLVKLKRITLEGMTVRCAQFRDPSNGS